MIQTPGEGCVQQNLREEYWRDVDDVDRCSDHEGGGDTGDEQDPRSVVEVYAGPGASFLADLSNSCSVRRRFRRRVSPFSTAPTTRKTSTLSKSLERRARVEAKGKLDDVEIRRRNVERAVSSF